MLSAEKIQKIMKAKTKITNDEPNQIFSSAILIVPENIGISRNAEGRFLKKNY